MVVALLIACSSQPTPVPEQAVYVLSAASARDEAHNALTIVDGTTWEIVREVALPKSLAFNIDRDPQGRLWIGFNGGTGWVDDRLHIYAPNGDLVQELRPCTQPVDVAFAAGHAFVACRHTGFSGRVVAVDLNQLETIRSVDIELDPPNNGAFLLNSTTATDEAVIVTGGGSAVDDGDGKRLLITQLNPQDLSFIATPIRVAGGNVHDIVTYQAGFYLLNNGSWYPPRAEAGDIIYLDAGNPPITTALSLVAGPVRGAVTSDGILYAYHEQYQWPSDQIPSPFETALISQIDLQSGAVATWDIPDVWRAFSDVAIIHDEIVLAGQGVLNDGDGLYRFDPETGQTELLVAIPDASGVVAGDEDTDSP
jgi:hypothetical protein